MDAPSISLHSILIQNHTKFNINTINVNSGLSQKFWLFFVVTVNFKKICTGCIENRHRY